MLFGGRILALLIWVCSLGGFSTLACLRFELSEPSFSVKRSPLKTLKARSHLSFDFERLLARFYLSGRNHFSSPGDLSLRAPSPQAIYLGKEGRLVFLRFEKKGYWVREGETIKGWRVVKIHPQAVELLFKDRRVVRKLFAPTPDSSRKDSVGSSSPKRLLVTREELERLTADLGSLFSGIRLRPYLKQGRIEGVRVEYVAPVSLFFRAGLRAGDIILSINGIPVRKHEDAFRILESLKTASSLTVKIRRGDKILTLSAEVR